MLWATTATSQTRPCLQGRWNELRCDRELLPPSAAELATERERDRDVPPVSGGRRCRQRRACCMAAVLACR